MTIEPWKDELLEKGEETCIQFSLVGDAGRHAVPVLLALDEALGTGIGRKDRNGKRGVIKLNSISGPESDEHLSWERLRYDRGLPFTPVSWKSLVESMNEFSRLSFISPARIMSGGRISGQPTLRDLMASLLRRISNLAYFHCGVELQADYRGLLTRAEEHHPESSFQRIRANRYSGRQRARFRVDGVTGTMDVDKVPGEFMPWLILGQYLGVGKSTSMGMGQYWLS